LTNVINGDINFPLNSSDILVNIIGLSDYKIESFKLLLKTIQLNENIYVNYTSQDTTIGGVVYNYKYFQDYTITFDYIFNLGIGEKYIIEKEFITSIIDNTNYLDDSIVIEYIDKGNKYNIKTITGNN